MNKLLMAGLLMGGFSYLQADYELFVNYTKPKSFAVAKTTNLFTGKYSDYQKNLGKFSSGQVNPGTTAFAAVSGGMAGLAIGAGSMGIGIAAGLLTPVILDAQADELFIRVDRLEGANGKFTLKKTFMVGNKNPSYSVQQANEIMKRGK